MYEPVLGTFLSRDPLLDSGSVLIGGGFDDFGLQDHVWSDVPIGERVNLYAYITNNPVNLTDPSGLLALSVASPTGNIEVCKPKTCVFSKCDLGTNTYALSKGKCKKGKELPGKKILNKKLGDVYFCIQCKSDKCTDGCSCDPDLERDKKSGEDKAVCVCNP